MILKDHSLFSNRLGTINRVLKNIDNLEKQDSSYNSNNIIKIQTHFIFKRNNELILCKVPPKQTPVKEQIVVYKKCEPQNKNTHLNKLQTTNRQNGQLLLDNHAKVKVLLKKLHKDLAKNELKRDQTRQFDDGDFHFDQAQIEKLANHIREVLKNHEMDVDFSRER